MTEYTVVERSTTIAAPAESIEPFLTDFHQWRDWSPWEDVDPDLKRTYGGPASGVGTSYEWAGNRKAGAGRMEITSVTTTAVALDLVFTKPFKSDSRSHFGLEPVADGTRVTWQVLTPKTFLTRIMGVFMNLDKMVGPDLEKGLVRLKAAVAPDATA